MEKADLTEVYLQEANLGGVHLQGANLSGAHLQGADLIEAHLQGANLSGARLQGADLIEAHLQGAELIGAHLQGANFQEAYLQGADMLQASLEGATLYKAYLQGANLTSARLLGANLMNAHMQGAHLSETNLQGAYFSETDMQGANGRLPFINDGVYDSYTHLAERARPRPYTVGFAERLKGFIDKEADLYSVVFAGGLSRKDVDSIVEDFPDERAKRVRERLGPHIDHPESHEPPKDGSVNLGAYTAEEAEQWIAEYNKAMANIPKAETD